MEIKGGVSFRPDYDKHIGKGCYGRVYAAIIDNITPAQKEKEYVVKILEGDND